MPIGCMGLPSLTAGQREAIREARRVSNPGCYASAFVLLVRPLVDAGLLSRQAALTIHALSGYSGGGRALIERWEDPNNHLMTLPYEVPYACDRVHKHIPEMSRYSGLDFAPYFLPAVGPFSTGMRVQVPLHHAMLNGASGERIVDVLKARYRNDVFVTLGALEENDGSASAEIALDPRGCNGTNRIELKVLAHPSGHVNLVATLDNYRQGCLRYGFAVVELDVGAPRRDRSTWFV